LFDLDGTLVDSRASVDRHWHRWAERNGLDPRQVLPFVYGHRSVDVIARFAPSLDPAVEAGLIDAEQAADTDGVCAIRDAAVVLDALPPARWAIVTSGTHAIAAARLRAATLPAPRVMVCAEDVEVGKPSPGAYLAAAAQLRVAPADCVVVEDAPSGVEAGRAAGMLVIGVVTTHAAVELGGADVILGSLGELLPALRELRAT
jgi:sugar-phosphatase